MKKVFLSLLVATIVLSTVLSCKKAAKALFPGAEFDLPEVQLPLDPVPLPPQIPEYTATIPTITQRLNIDSIIRANTGNNFGIGDISSVKLKQLTLTIISGADSSNNLQNFKDASFKMSSSSKPSPKIDVASITFDQTYATQKIVTPTNDAELRPYLDGNELYYDVTATIRKGTTRKLTFSIVARMIMK